MRDYRAFRQATIRYWERRRIIYNLVLVPPSGFSYMICAGTARVGDDFAWHPYFVLLLFMLSAVGANICYSLAYGLEFIFGSDDPASRWLRFGRSTAFGSGLVFAAFLSFIGGRNIAFLEYSYR